MDELKNWIVDQLVYWNNYDPRSVCYGYSVYVVEANKKVLTQVLEKIRAIEKEMKKDE